MYNKYNINDFVLDYVERLNNNNIKKEDMLSNTDYIIWLEKFTLTNPRFNSNEWLYSEEKISKEDNDNVNKLCLFYEIISNYAEDNYIYPEKCDFGNYYNITFNNNYYEIGILVGQGTIFFCNRKQLNNNIEYIDFNNIMNNKKKENVDIISKELNNLSNNIMNLYMHGIPLNALIDLLNKAILDLKKEDNKQKKVLKK